MVTEDVLVKEINKTMVEMKMCMSRLIALNLCSTKRITKHGSNNDVGLNKDDLKTLMGENFLTDKKDKKNIPDYLNCISVPELNALIFFNKK